IDHRKRDRRAAALVRRERLDVEIDRALFGELDRVRQQVAQNLTQTHVVGRDRRRQAFVDLDVERQAFLLGQLPERAVNVFFQQRELDVGGIDRDGAGLDAREVENFID